MTQIFKASLDNLSKIVSALVVPILCIMPFTIYWSLRNQPDKRGEEMMLFMVFFLPIVLVIAYLLAPKQYEVSDNELVFVNNFGKKVILKNNIDKVNAITKTDLGFAIRTFGSGGLFGYYGMFRSKNLGKMRWFCTRKDNLVLIETKDGNQYMASPDDVSGFIKSLV